MPYDFTQGELKKKQMRKGKREKNSELQRTHCWSSARSGWGKWLVGRKAHP